MTIVRPAEDRFRETRKLQRKPDAMLYTKLTAGSGNATTARAIIDTAYAKGIRGVTYGTTVQELRVHTYDRHTDGKWCAEIVSGPSQSRHGELATGATEEMALAVLEAAVRSR